MRRKLLPLLLLLPLVGVAAWVAHRSRVQRDDPAAVLAALKAAAGPSLPEAKAVGARERGEATRYNAETLYEVIDGAAEAFIANGFEAALFAPYTFDGGLEVDGEAHRFKLPAGAQRQLQAERPSSAVPVPGMTDVFSDGTVLVAGRDRDLLKLTALAQSPAARDALVGIATAWKNGR